MTFWEFLKQWRSRRLVLGLGASVLLHIVLTLVVLWALTLPSSTLWRAKPGDALIVDLPNPDEPAPAGLPDAPASPAASAPPAPAPTAPPAPVAAPPAPPRHEAPAPHRAAPAARAPEPAPRPAPPRAAPPEPARAAEPAAAEPAPRTAAAPPSAAPAPAGDSAPASSRREGAERQVASLPPGGGAPGAPAGPDMRSALRRRGSGPGGHGGIEGDTVQLDSKDSRYSDFLEQVRRQIKEHWNYPCVKNHSTAQCEYLSAQLLVEFGILKSGQLQYVEVLHSSGYDVYDGSALTAIRLASPYPPVPPEMMALMRAGSTGAVIGAKFNYITETSLTNIR